MMITTNPESTARYLPYLGGIDGLRALAVLAVLLYHGGITWMPAGFLGVEVFFAISGFLITALLLGEYDATGTISLRQFWIRRARRLLPALFALLIGVVILTLAMAPDVVAQVGREIWAAVLYVSNWFFIADNQSYFETFGRASPLQHLWSLAVEEQFYLLWPIALLFLLKRLRRRWVFVLIVAGIVISTAMMIGLWVPRTDPTRVYYGTDTRAAGLLLGAAAAFLLRRFLVNAHRLKRTKAMPWLPDIVGLMALVGLVLLFIRLNAFSVFLYRGGFLLTSALTIIVIAVVTLPGSRLGTLMATRPIRWVGTRSYALYLWHWPIFMITRPRLDVTIEGIELLVLRFVITACLAELSYRLVERRFRYAPSQQPRLRLRRPAMGAVAATGVVAMIVVTASMMGAPEAPAAQDEMIAAADSIVITSEPETSASPSTSGTKSETAPGATSTVTDADSVMEGQPNGTEPAGSTPPPPSSGTPDSTVDNQSGQKKQNAKAEKNQENPPSTDHPAITSDRPTRRPDTTAITAISTSSSTTTTTPPTTTTTTAPVPTLPEGVLFVGDSVMLGAHDALLELDTSVAVDARVSRQWWDIVDEVDALGTEKQPPVVVLHLGTNGTVDSETFDVVMGTIMKQEGTRVLIVNARVPQLWEADVNEAIAAGVDRWPAATMVDWYAASEDHLEYFVSDGVHLTSEGMDAYGALIEQALLDLS